MLVNVKVWEKELHCDICSNDMWYQNILKVEFESTENALVFEEEARYLFECSNCGNCKIFGKISRDIDDINLTVKPVHNG